MVGTQVWLYRPATDRQMQTTSRNAPYTFIGEGHNKDGQ